MIVFESFYQQYEGIAESNIFVDSANTLFATIQEERNKQVSGYYKLPFDTMALQQALAYKERNKQYFNNITDLVIVGIGGSSLGIRAIDSTLKTLAKRNHINISFLEHTDPFETKSILESINPKHTHFIIISKSGTTIETSSLFKYLISRYNLLSPDNKHHLCCITDEHSPLHKLALQEGLEAFCIQSNVGGRFSVLSFVGLLPLCLLGYDVATLLQGARAMMERFFARQEEHILHKALFLAKQRVNFPMNVLFSYSSIFTDLNRWFVQLWGESLGKINSDKQYVGLTPIALVGSIDQHSFLQLIIQGARDKFVSFLSLDNACSDQDSQYFIQIPESNLAFLESTNFVNKTSFLALLNLQKQATLETLQEANIPLDSITLQALDEWHIGALIVYFELLTSCVGIALGINTYDQPGVEFGKQRLHSYFSQ